MENRENPAKVSSKRKMLVKNSVGVNKSLKGVDVMC